MITAVMQPYFLPYIAYFQLVSAVDSFVILDDVNFITRGWINRNNILVNGKAHLFSIPLKKPSQNAFICDTEMMFPLKEKEKFLKTVYSSYKKAPIFNTAYPLIEEIVMFENNDITSYIHNSIDSICLYLNIETKTLRSTSLQKNCSLKSHHKILEICKILNTSMYINPIGGIDLYSQEDFKRENIELRFLYTRIEDIEYKQFKDPFVPYLSIVDVLMFNETATIKTMLGKYTLEDGKKHARMA